MKLSDNPNPFAGNPLDRASELRAIPAWIAERRSDPASLFLPLWRGDPLVAGGRAVWLRGDALSQFPGDATVVFLGLNGSIGCFAVDGSAAPSAETAPFADLGRYMPLREAAGEIGNGDLAIIGEARWLLDWHGRHRFCAVCGNVTRSVDGGAKRACTDCAAEHFPRSDPVAIVLAVHEGACLLGRNPRFPPTFFSALAGYVEAAETPEECAVRELREEAGVILTDVRYCFSQPWPFPSSLMMGFIAAAQGRELVLDRREIEEALWTPRAEIIRLLNGEQRPDLRLPPRFTIARRLIETWALA